MDHQVVHDDTEEIMGLLPNEEHVGATKEDYKGVVPKLHQSAMELGQTHPGEPWNLAILRHPPPPSQFQSIIHHLLPLPFVVERGNSGKVLPKD